MTRLLTLLLVLSYLEARFALAERLFVGSASVMLLLAVPGFALHWAFVRRLRGAHAGTWRSLGEPTIVYYGSYLTGARVMRFLRSASYETLGDPYLDTLCRAYRACVAVYAVAFVGLLSGSTMLFLAML